MRHILFQTGENIIMELKHGVVKHRFTIKHPQ